MPNIPSRQSNAITGSQFIQKIMPFKTDDPGRNKIILEEFKNGNVPSFLRKFVPITIKNNNMEITYNVSPDYMCIGSDQDYVRVSMNGDTSQKVADMFNCILPTKKMVDDIHKNAKIKLSPAAMSGGATVSGKHYSGKEFINQKMQHADSLEEHNRMVERQLAKNKDYKPGDLVAGNKKDIIISDLLAKNPDRVNIYGWHYENGKKIQNSSTIHERAYQDYSHGIRLIDRLCTIKVGDSPPKQMDLSDVLRDKELAGLVSDQGVLKVTSYNDIKSQVEKSKSTLPELKQNKPVLNDNTGKEEKSIKQESNKNILDTISPKVKEVLNDIVKLFN